MRKKLLTPEVKSRLLESIDADRLVVLCGAGLSMAPPSNLPSAQKVAEECFDAYKVKADPEGFDPKLRRDLAALAEYFANQNNIEHFIGTLVPWGKFVGSPNPGHAAMADFLITRAAVAGLSGNYDELVERKAQQYGADFLISLNGDEAIERSSYHAPLLKFHGCSCRSRGSTVWTLSQIQGPTKDQTIVDRIDNSKSWMEVYLRQKDLLIVGFWSDWDYLNQIMGRALKGIDPKSITVIDPSERTDLESKAPNLWGLFHQKHVKFCHVRESGAEVLDELRRAFSENYLRQVLHAGWNVLKKETDIDCDQAWFNINASLCSESLYGWRRDAEGVPNSRPAKKKCPDGVEVLGFFHLLLRRAGAVQYSKGYKLQDRSIRVVNGGGYFLNRLKEAFIEAPTVRSTDYVVAVGSTYSGLPGNIVRAGISSNIIRPAAGGKWLTFDQAREELNV